MSQKTPIVLNDNKNKHIPLGSDDTLTGESIPLSSDAGNQLQLRSDGLYTGSVAPADISNLYVSNQGIDTNSGTKDAPLKTIGAAISKISARDVEGTYTIHLKAGQSFTFTAYDYIGDATKQIILSYYDDPIFGENTGNAGFWVVTDSRLQKPKVVFNTAVLSDGLVHRVCIGMSVSSQLTLRGVDVEARTDAGQDVGGANFIYASKIDFQGSKLILNTNRSTFGSATNVLLRHCDYENNVEGGQLFVGDYSPQLFQQTLHTPGTTVSDPYGQLPNINVRTTNLVSTLKVENVMALATYDTETKTMFGFNTNWDVFATGS